MAGAFKSVEHFTFTISGTERFDPAANIGDLGLGQTLANCVPFVTKRCSDETAISGDLSSTQVDVHFASGPNRVIAERDATTGEIVVEVAVVEFDPARTNVYTAAWQLSDALDLETVALGTPVTVANTFLVNHSYQNSGSGDLSSHLFRSRITGVSELQFERVSNNGTVDGHWYLVESTAGDFTVEASDVQLSATTSGFDTVVAASDDLDTIFTLGSWMTSATGKVCDENTINATLTANTLTVTRDNGTGTIDWTGFIVTMLDGTSVQRGTILSQGATSPDAETIPVAVTVADSIAIIAGNYASTMSGSFTGIANSDVEEAMCGLSFTGSPSSTSISVEHNTSQGQTGQDISWEVIEWGTGAGATARRVMVR